MLPPDLRTRVKLPQNKYDCLIYTKGHLFPIEMKSTKSKSISFSESIIKQNQIDNLVEANKYEGVIPGFLFNFRLEDKHRTFFVHIEDFEKIRYISQNELDHTYKGRINKSSISFSVCEEVGIEVSGILKKKNYRWYVNKLIQNLIDKYEQEFNLDEWVSRDTSHTQEAKEVRRKLKEYRDSKKYGE
ncbi:MAG: hypothetical protein ACI35O_13900 [Bacillaceae bacterium]